MSWLPAEITPQKTSADFRHGNILIRLKFVLKSSVLLCLFKLVAVVLNEFYALLQLIDCAVRNGFHVFKKSVRILI